MRTTWSRVLLATLLLLVAAAMVYGDRPKAAEPVMPLVMERGAMITHVRPGSAAEEAGLEVGDVILSVNGLVITSEAVLEQALKLSPIARLEVMKREEGRKERVMAFLKEDGLGVLVKMVGPDTAPFFPRYRRWV